MNNNNLDDILDENVSASDSRDILDESTFEVNLSADEEISPEQTPSDERKSGKGVLIRRIIMAVALCVFVFSAIMLIQIFFKYKDGRDLYQNVSNEIMKPNPNRPSNSSTDEEDAFLYNHAALLAINKDAVGYLVIPGIGVQLPVVYRAGDNNYYLDHAIDGSQSMFGSLFIDGNITQGLKSSHVIIYGHNMYDGSMFAGLAKYKNQDFVMDSKNTTFYIYSEDKCYTYRIFSVYETPPTSDTYQIEFSSLAALRAYAGDMKQKSLFDLGVPITNANQVVTFSTCTSDSQRRMVVHGILVGTKTIAEN